jgi:hypothetical protein
MAQDFTCTPRVDNLDAYDVFSYGCWAWKGALNAMGKAPKQLEKAGRALWVAMLETYEFTAAEESF